jgi:hypothetical protein
MKAVVYLTCDCGSLIAPIMADIPSDVDGVAFEMEGICPVCLTELQVGVAKKKTTVPSDLSSLE